MARAEDRISLDHLAALNDEIAALVRAGVSLEVGLSGLGRDIPGRLGTVVRRLGARLEQGESLAEAVAEEGDRFPAAYRAVVEAGLNSGRLSAALESLTVSLRNLAELRRGVSAALIYPVLVAVVAYGLFVAFVIVLAPRMHAAFESFGIATGGGFSFLIGLNETVAYWAPVLPLLVVAGAVACTFWVPGADQAPSGFTLLFPRVRKMRQWYRYACFAEILALLVEHEVALPAALRLAGECTGSRKLNESAMRLAAAIERGESVGESVRACPAIPPFLALALSSRQRDPAPILRRSAKIYRDRAAWTADAVASTFPVVALLAIGGTATLLYVLTLFGPWIDMLLKLARG